MYTVAPRRGLTCVSGVPLVRRACGGSNAQLGSLYQGLKAQIVCLAASNFVYFYTYNSLKVCPHHIEILSWWAGVAAIEREMR